MMTTMMGRRLLAASALLLAVGLAACEPDNGKPADTGPANPADTSTSATSTSATSPAATSPATTSSAATTAPPTTAAMSAPPETKFVATEYSYAGPGSVPAGLNAITVQNQGKELHQIQIVQLDAGKTFDELAAALQSPDAPPPTWATMVGGPNAAAPGQSATTFADLKPGNYAILCGIPDANGKPHFASGMIRPLKVTESTAASAAAPVADVTVTGKEFAFGAPDTLTVGKHVVTFNDMGQQPHEAVLVKLNPGTTAQDFMAAFAPGAKGPPPGMPVGGVAAIAPGTSQTFPVDLVAGHYALICFVDDPATHKPHGALGMTKEFDVK
jgi:hypothetical protein